jgi:hypothetical protein
MWKKQALGCQRGRPWEAGGSDRDSAASLWQWGSKVVGSLHGQKTAILPLTPALVVPSPAVLGPGGAGPAAAESQAMESVTYQFTGNKLQALFRQVLEADRQPPAPNPSCMPLFHVSLLGHQSPLISGERGPHFSRRGPHSLQSMKLSVKCAELKSIWPVDFGCNTEHARTHCPAHP